ncbi:UDP-glycosyltransferase 87A2-like [Pistacia vera]|uniref:UDP-glycosyltransferase 87A2-like n=1 Tax=Pistacia vera TaxID=55513 RepID=UPI00126397F3|nr:UDP-glycosyltransferase 87A2-like [Pistacia vera]
MATTSGSGRSCTDKAVMPIWLFSWPFHDLWSFQGHIPVHDRLDPAGRTPLRQLPVMVVGYWQWLGVGGDDVEYIPGISSSNLADLKAVFQRNDHGVLQLALDCISRVPKAQYLLFTSIYELEPQVTNNLRETFPFPVYPIGPAIPYLEREQNNYGTNNSTNDHGYIQWLDSKPADSVLYISLGSFLSVSSTQMDEILAGLQNSNVNFVWVARGEASRLKEICGDKGLVLPWCDQLRVLCHSSVGGFWTHCGWNSTLEAVFAGVPMLTFPLFLDQDPNSNQIVEDWKIGWEAKREIGTQKILTREEIAEVIKRFMDLNSDEGIEVRRKVRQLRDICQGATTESGSSVINLTAFIQDISQGHNH